MEWTPTPLPPPPPSPPGREPPSGSKARTFTFLAAIYLWFLLPFAVIYQRRAFREAAASNGQFVWERKLTNRPVVLWLRVLGGSLGLILAMAMVGMYGDPA